MQARLAIVRRPQDTRRQFLKRTVAAQLHFAALVLTLAGFTVLLPLVGNDAPEASRLAHLTANGVFLAAGALVFAISSTYHFLHDGYRISDWLIELMERLDQLSIYCFIAACYTVFFLNTVAQPWLTRLIVLVWAVAAFGGVYTIARDKLPAWARSRALYTSLFVLMGWTMFVRVGEIFHAMTTLQACLFLGGGAAYTLGAGVYAWQKPNLFGSVFGYHELWHLAVMVGFGMHYFLMLSFYGGLG